MEPIKGLTHVAIIPDGNRRWAAMKGLSPYCGHQAGAERMHNVVEHLIDRGVKYLTVWGFSTDNWKRTNEEITSLFNLLQLWIETDTPWLHSRGVKLKHIGCLRALPRSLQETIGQAINLTQANAGMTLNLAFNYSGRAEIIDAINHLIANGIPFKGGIPDVTEDLFSRYLYTDGAPDVDLIIRTANELRASNFMLWQTAYAEYYFTGVFWPDFDNLELEKALETYCQRNRRFGGD